MQDSLILAADTALGACSCAVLRDGEILAHRFEPMERGHAERLAPMVAEAMGEAGLSFSQLTRLGVTTGPGTFTGQRVGLAFLRGLRLALNIPLIGVTTLEAMAAAARAETGCKNAAALHDAKRGEVYFEVLEEDRVLIPASIAPLDEAVAAIAAAASPARLVLAGTAAQMAGALLPGAVVSGVRQPDALWVARLAADLPPAPEAPRPLYLRPPDAKLPAPPPP